MPLDLGTMENKTNCPCLQGVPGYPMKPTPWPEVRPLCLPVRPQGSQQLQPPMANSRPT